MEQCCINVDNFESTLHQLCISTLIQHNHMTLIQCCFKLLQRLVPTYDRDRHGDRQIDRHGDTQTDMGTDIGTDKHTHTHTHTQKVEETQTVRSP